MKRKFKVNPMRLATKSHDDVDELSVIQAPKVEGVFMDEATNEISIVGEIKDGFYNDFKVLFNELVDKQYELREDARQPITVYISSVGGELFQGLNIINEIQNAQLEGITVITKAGDVVASAALAIFMMGSLRIANRYSYFLFHQPSGGTRVDQFVQQERNWEFSKGIWKELKRLTKENTNVTDEWLDGVYEGAKDYTFFGHEAVDLGFADIVLQPETVLIRTEEEVDLEEASE